MVTSYRGATEDFVRELARLQEDCTHSGKSHYDASGFWGRVHYGIGITSMVAAGAASITAMTASSTWAAGLAAVASGLAALLTFLAPNEREAKHKAAGDRFMGLAGRARRVRELARLDSRAVLEKISLLANEKDTLNEVSPRIPRRAYIRAQKGIAAGEALHAVDEGR